MSIVGEKACDNCERHCGRPVEVVQGIVGYALDREDPYEETVSGKIRQNEGEEGTEIGAVVIL
jgi:hypothetical protein